MKISVKTLKGNHFDLDVQADDTVIAVKKQIEDMHGKETFPCAQQLLIHQGKVLRDETTMVDNQVEENGFLVVMLTKNKAAPAPASGGASATAAAPAAPAPAAPAAPPAPAPAPPAPAPPAPAPSPAAPASPAGAVPAPAPTEGGYGDAASAFVAGEHLEGTIQQIVDMGAGSWTREMVVRALRAAFNNPERAVDYLYSGIPENADVGAPRAQFPPAAGNVPAPAAAPSPTPVPNPAPAPQPTAAPGGPNAVPLDLFPQGMPGMAAGGGAGNGNLDFLRNNPQFQALRAMVHASPQILQPMLQELGRQNPQLLRLINENQAEFFRLINEAGGEGGEGDLLGQLGNMPQSISVTPEEREAIERLEALGFERHRVIEAFLICDKNEQLAANYLLEHAGEFED